VRPLKNVSIFAGFAFLLTQGRAASHPTAALRLLGLRPDFFRRDFKINKGGGWGLELIWFFHYK